MNRIGIALIWSFTLIWAGNYVALVTGLSPTVTASFGVAVGVIIAIDPITRAWRESTASTGLAANEATSEPFARS